jgi:hypothetical protein
MVSLGRKQRSAVFSFWRQVFLCLTIFTVTYLSVIRPTQKWIINKAIFPIVYWNYGSNQDIQFQPGAIDEIFVINQAGQNSVITKLELPFNSHILLALTLFVAARNHKFIRMLVIYQLALFFIIPFLGWFLINGQNWLSIILNFHEKAHKVGFLILGLLFIKSKADSVSVKEILN